MNEQIKKLAEQAGLIADGEHWFSSIQETDVRSIDLERFAELVRQDERQALAQKQTKCPRCGEVNPAEIHTCSPQVAQEPVAWKDKAYGNLHHQNFGNSIPLYTAPPKQWVGLTDEEIKGILDCRRGGLVDIKKAEQFLKDKNT